MMRSVMPVACVGLCCVSLCAVAEAQTVRKIAEPFDVPAYEIWQWSPGTGKALASKEIAPETRSKGSMEFQAQFLAGTFQGVVMRRSQPLVIPGNAKTITIRAKRGDNRYGLKLEFMDGWGRENVNGQALEWWLPFDGKKEGWQTFTFQVPANWVQPVTIQGLMTHNWETQQLKQTASFWVDELEVETDISDVDPATGLLKTWKPEPTPADPAKALKEAPKTPLVTVTMGTGVESNVFVGEEPKVTLQVQNWTAGTLNGQGTCAVLDESDKVLSRNEMKVAVDSSETYVMPLPVPAFGRYRYTSTLQLGDGSKHSREMAFAKLPPMKELTEEQKTASPYGLNVHSGGKIVLAPFKKAGIVWFREYAFEWGWLRQAKGADKRYAGWPYFTKMMQAYDMAGVKVLPVLQRSMTPPTVKDGKVVGRIGPDAAWAQELADVILAFPQVTHWELSNEYDLPATSVRAEELCEWANYGGYHRQFADEVSVLSMGEKTAVENGRAGIWSGRVKSQIQRGDFDKIGVVNSHYYSGTEAPETSFENHNMGFDASAQLVGAFYDQLRDVKQVAQLDGKKRQSWLTEFGWDTLAGPVVSPYEQAVFLQRAWMLAMAAGTDKAFWFYNFDAADPKVFFDGCGLLAANGEPKLSLCAMAGMTSILPNPHYVGSLDAGENTWGYLFESDGKLVAALWTIKGDNGPTVNFRAEQLYDYLGNKLQGTSAQLKMSPVYAVGLDKQTPWYKQTAYSLKTQLVVPAVAGDVVTPVLSIDNNRDTAIDCRVTLVLPDGWKAQNADLSAKVPAGGKQELSLPFTVNVLEAQGIREAKLVIYEGEKLKEVPFRLSVQPALAMQVGVIEGKPGPATSRIKVTNLSAAERDATLRIKVPGSWTAATPTIPLKALKPKEQREVKLDLTWSPNWGPQESAVVELDSGEAGGKPIVQPLVPSEYRLYAAKGVKVDGDLSDWPAAAELPNWMLASTLGDAQAKVYLAWAKEGLYAAVQVHDSKVVNKNPQTFWAGDVLEMFLDTRNDKRARSFEAGDHQFWFVPMVDQNRVYVGQWKRGAEIADTQYDLQGVKSAAKKTADGYIMEFLLPASAIQQYKPATGGKIGLNLNLSVHGQKQDREVFWPQRKELGAPAHPEVWGTLELVN